MKLLLALAVLVSIAAAAEFYRGKPELDNHWKTFKGKHGKQYKNSADEVLRRKNWEAAREKVSKHNEEAAAGQHSYTMAENHFSDWHTEELQALLKAVPTGKPQTRKGDSDESQENGESAETGESSETVGNRVALRQLPTSVDYRTSSCLPAVKDQGNCGSCWSFSANTPLEYALCNKTGQAVVLSEQQLVDCSSAYKNYGCNGGFYTNAWSYVKTSGQTSSTTYPYTGTAGTCSYSSSQSVGSVASIVRVTSKDTTAIQTALASYGPVSAALQVVTSFYSYSSGIYSDTSCSSDGTTVNHAVVLVGYGTQSDTDYWIVRNSWATTWGQSGYVLMKRGVNQCNIEAWVAYPTV